jgi:hypothetical protein
METTDQVRAQDESPEESDELTVDVIDLDNEAVLAQSKRYI